MLTTLNYDGISEWSKRSGFNSLDYVQTGFGVYSMRYNNSNSYTYTGQWKYHRMHGFGTMEFKNGKIIEGLFNNGQPTAQVITTQRA